MYRASVRRHLTYVRRELFSGAGRVLDAYEYEGTGQSLSLNVILRDVTIARLS